MPQFWWQLVANSASRHSCAVDAEQRSACRAHLSAVLRDACFLLFGCDGCAASDDSVAPRLGCGKSMCLLRWRFAIFQPRSRSFHLPQTWSLGSLCKLCSAFSVLLVTRPTIGICVRRCCIPERQCVGSRTQAGSTPQSALPQSARGHMMRLIVGVCKLSLWTPYSASGSDRWVKRRS